MRRLLDIMASQTPIQRLRALLESRGIYREALELMRQHVAALREGEVIDLDQERNKRYPPPDLTKTDPVWDNSPESVHKHTLIAVVIQALRHNSFGPAAARARKQLIDAGLEDDLKDAIAMDDRGESEWLVDYFNKDGDGDGDGDVYHSVEEAERAAKAGMKHSPWATRWALRWYPR